MSAKGKGQACVCFLAKCQWQRNAERNANRHGLVGKPGALPVFLWQGETCEKGESE